MAFKRSLFGYRRREVEEALAARDVALAEGATALAWHAAELERYRARVMQLELVCHQLADRVVMRQRELATVRAELAELGTELGGVRAELAAARGELARGRAGGGAASVEEVRRQARGQATRIRLRALRDAAELSERFEELTQSPTAARRRLLDSLHGAIDRFSRDDVLDPPAGGNGHAPGSADDLFEGMVEVEVGPLDDFSQLVGFEDAAGAIAATSEISVRRFTRGRATLEMKLAEPVELLRELEERAPFEFRVRDRRFDRLVLDVDAE